MTPRTLPITLVGGFLGAGKTTLLQSMLRQLSGRRVAVLVNDFGDLEVDADLVESVSEGVMRLKGGCMCCAIRESVVAEVLKLAEQSPAFEHVVIEASGASDTAALRDTFRTLERHQTVRLDGLITVVDVELFEPRHPDVGLLQRCQVMAADVVVLNKVDRVDAARMQAVRGEILELAPNARVWQTEYSKVPQEVLMGGPLAEGAHVAPLAASAEGLLSTEVLVLGRPVPGRALVAWLAGLPRDVFRAKGFVRLEERPEDKVLLQVVSGRVHVQTHGLWGDAEQPSQLVLIAAKGRVDFDALQTQLGEL